MANNQSLIDRRQLLERKQQLLQQREQIQRGGIQRGGLSPAGGGFSSLLGRFTRPSVGKTPVETTEGLIKERSKQDALDVLREEVQTPFRGNILQRGAKAGVTGLKTSAVPFAAGEAAIANPIFSAAFRGERDPRTLLGRTLKGASLQEPTQFGDIIRATKFGGPFNEAIAATIGLVLTLGLTNLASKGKLIKGAKKARQAFISAREARKARGKFFFKQKADQLSEGADEVTTAMRKEFDSMYNKIGDNTLDINGRVALQDIVTRNADITRKLLKQEEKLGKAVFEKFGKGQRVLKSNINAAKTVKTEIGKAVRPKVWSGIERATEVEAQMIDDYFTLNDTIARSAGGLKGDLLALNSRFKRLINFNKVIKGITTKAGGVTSTKIKNIRQSSMQGELFELEQFTKEFFPQTTQILKEIDKVNRNIAIGKFATKAAVTGAATGLGIGAFRSLQGSLEDVGGSFELGQ